jgi:hypothetical protein
MDFELRVERGGITTAEELDRVRAAEIDILRTMSVYLHAMDYSKPDVWATCFTEQGIYRARFPNGDTREIVGREALTKYAAAHVGPPTRYPKHLSWAPVLDVRGDTAVGTGMFAIINQGPTGPIVEVFGRYDDELQRGADGIWRFSSRTSNVESTAETFKPTAAPAR